MGLDAGWDQAEEAGWIQPRGSASPFHAWAWAHVPPTYMPSLLQQKDAAPSTYIEAAAAGRNFPDPFPQAPPSPALQDSGCLCCLTFKLCLSYSMCSGAHSNQKQRYTVLTRANICTATSTLWGLSPGKYKA